ncbi:MAG: hypothetical protein IJR46_06875, partial [Neisseriaceae bacterium]|nr:hypothetical protein [Neisseriaceae bacterium]
CSTAKRLPPPCAGMPVKVPQAVSDKREMVRNKGRSLRENRSGCLKDLKEKVKQLCLFAVCCLLFAVCCLQHNYTLSDSLYQSYLVENIEKNGFYQ